MNRLEWTFCTLFTIMEYIFFLSLVFKKKPIFRNDKRIILISTSFVVNFICLALMPGRLLLFIATQFCCLSCIYYFFEEPLSQTIKDWMSAFVFLSMSENLIRPIVIALTPHAGAFLHTVLCILFILFALFIYYLCIGRKMKEIQLDNTAWLLFMGSLIPVKLMISCFNKIISDRQSNAGLLFMTMGGFGVCVLIFTLLYYFSQKEDYRIRTEISERLNEQQKEYFMGLLKQEERTRQFRHDAINHLLALNTLAHKREYASLEQYLDDLLAELNGLSKTQYDVGNDIVNSILNHYLAPMQETCHIEVKGYMEAPPRISQKDFCVLIANIVTNATEAAIQSKEKHILFEIEEGEHYLNIRAENTYAGTLSVDKTGNLITRKADQKNHGLGLKNVKEVVKKYKGKEEIKTDAGLFRIEIFLPL